MSQSSSAKRRFSSTSGDRKTKLMKFCETDRKTHCDAEPSSRGDADDEDSADENNEGGNATDEEDWTGKAELHSSVDHATMEAPAPTTATATCTVTTSTVSTAAVAITADSGLGYFSKLPAELRSLIYGFFESETTLPHIDSACRPSKLWSEISTLIGDDARTLYQCSHRTLVLELNPSRFHHLENSFPARSLEERRADIAPYMVPLTSQAHDLSMVNDVFIVLADDDPEYPPITYVFALEHTKPTSPYRPDHEPFRLYLGDPDPDSIAMHGHLHNDVYRTRLQTKFRLLEMAVYSLLYAVFKRNLPSTSSGYTFRKAIGFTYRRRSSMANYPCALAFAPGMLSEHLLDLWMSKKDLCEFHCLIYRFQLSHQGDNGNELIEEFWLDDGKSLSHVDWQNVVSWREVWEAGKRFGLASDLLNFIEDVFGGACGDDIVSCELATHIESGKTTFISEVTALKKDWDNFRKTMPPNAPDFDCPSKQTFEAFIVERNTKARMILAESVGRARTGDDDKESRVR